MIPEAYSAAGPVLAARTRVRRLLFTIATAAAVVRVAVRLHSGSDDFWQNGYSFLFDLSRNIAGGRGLAFDGDGPTVYRVPIYPTFIAALTLGHKAFLPLVFAQSLIGGVTVLCAGVLAVELFGSVAGAIAAAVAAVYPYYVVHDTAMQETGLFTCITLIAVLLALRARRTMSPQSSAITGFALAAGVLTRSTLAPFAAIVPVWLGWAGAGTMRARVASALICGGALVIGVSPWLIRSYALLGTPVLQSDTGARLWDGNNPYTFSRYPFESIDRSKALALDALTTSDRAEIEGLSFNEALVDRWFLRKALEFIGEHPWLAIANGFRKVRAAFSWLPSPRRSFWPNLVFLGSYGPVMTLGLFGMVLGWRSWREHTLIYALFLSFAGVTAIFFGHTSHRSYLDVYWIVFSASVIGRLIKPYHIERLCAGLVAHQIPWLG